MRKSINFYKSISVKEQLRFFLLLFSLIFINEAFSTPAPVADFTASNFTICTGLSTVFTSTSTGSITGYSWNFGPGASPATANTAGPHTVIYSTPGPKTISLSVTGPGGTTTETKTNYIIVGSDRLKIMSYNLLNYPVSNADTTYRNPFYRTTLSEIDPDILVVEEMNSSSGMDGFLSHVLNASSNTYSKGTFINGFDSDNGIFYKTSKFNFISNTPIQTDLRDISEFKIVHILTGDTLRIYACHLKASTGITNEDQRALEVDSLRKVTNALPAGSNFIVCGDFNIYKTSESAYSKLLQDNPGDDGNFFDPLTLTGTWNKLSYAPYHTQSTRDTALGDGGSTGGLNDRFDMMLYSSAINQSGGISYVAGSLTAFGNDGNHFDTAINIMPNAAVSQTNANALYYSSDHIPIFESFDFQLNNCLAADAGALSLQNPATSICPALHQPMQVRIKNYGVNSINFTTVHLDLNLQVTLPSLIIKSFTKTVSSGILGAGATLDVTFDSTLDMTALGNYIFNANTVFSPDVNASNNSMPATTVTVGQFGVATVTPSGPTTFCSGGSVTLTASSGSNFLWSNGSTLQAIIVSAPGNYSVSLTDPNNCQATSGVVSVTVNNFQMNGTLFTETMGTVGGTTTISTHELNNGFDNDNFTMSGSGDVRNTNVSSGYPGASGLANVFLTNTSAGKNFIIAGINTTGLTNLQLTFGIFKSTTSANGDSLLVKVSTDGTAYTTLSYPSLPTGTGTATWHQRTITSGIPATASLYIQFVNIGVNVTQFRIDDVYLTYTLTSANISTPVSGEICPGNFITLSATNAVSYLWNTGASSSSINVSTAGNFYCTLTGDNGCNNTTNTITTTVKPALFSITGGGSFCTGGSGVAIGLNGSETGVSYQLKNGSTSVGSAIPGTGNPLSFGNQVVAGTYTVVGTNVSAACTLTMSGNAIVIANPVPNIYNVTGGGNYCSVPGTGVPVSLSNSENGISYQLYANNLISGSAINGNGFPFSFGNQTVTGNYSIIATNNSTACTNTMNGIVMVNQTTATVLYHDSDGDGYGNPNDSIVGCTTPSGYINDRTDCNDLSSTVHPGAVEICGNGIDDNCNNLIDENCSDSLSVKLFIEGYYNGNNSMRAVIDPVNYPSLCDTFVLKFAVSVFPYSIFYSVPLLLNTNGIAKLSVPNGIMGNSLYLVIDHRNALETWSSVPVIFNQSNITYDFTDALSKAFGNNLKDLGDGNFALYSGDVNHDGQINISDLDMIKNSAQNFEEGYIDPDLTGDDMVESIDFSLIENNLQRPVERP